MWRSCRKARPLLEKDWTWRRIPQYSGAKFKRWIKIILIVNSLNILLRRFVLFQACLCLYSGSALAVSLEVSGSSNPGELVCPRFVASPATRPSQPAVPQEELEAPPLEDIEEIIELPGKHAPQHLLMNSGRHSALPSIGFWGDSHLAAAFFSDELVSALGLSKEDAKPGFLPPTMGRGGVRLPIRKHCKSPGWRFANAYVARGDMLKVGPALTALENTRDDVALWVDFRYQDARPALEQLTVFFREIDDQPVVLEVEVDDVAVRQVVLEKGESQLQLNGTQAFSQLKLRVAKGALAIEGFAPVYVSPARLKLDIFGIPGATARSWRVADPHYLRTRLTDPEYDLVILEYGTNEGADRKFDPDSYRASLTASIRGMKEAFPNAQCMLIGPTDRGLLVKKHAHANTKKKGAGKNALKDRQRVLASRAELLRFAHVHARIAEIQNSLAQTYGCAFWDWQLAMGGPGGAYKWFYKTPPLMAKDLIHLTRKGYQESARQFLEDSGIGEWLK